MKSANILDKFSEAKETFIIRTVFGTVLFSLITSVLRAVSWRTDWSLSYNHTGTRGILICNHCVKRSVIERVVPLAWFLRLKSYILHSFSLYMFMFAAYKIISWFCVSFFGSKNGKTTLLKSDIKVFQFSYTF